MALIPWEKDGTIVEEAGVLIECETCPCDGTCCYPTIPGTLTLTITAITAGITCLNVSDSCTLTWDTVDSWDGTLTTTGAGGCPASYAVELQCPGDDNPDNFSLLAEFYSALEAPDPGGTCSPLFLVFGGTAAENGGADSIGCEITE